MDSGDTDNITALIRAALDETYREAGWSDSTNLLSKFRSERASDLSWLVARYTGDPLVGPLPELSELAPILERLEHDPTGLTMHWPRELPQEWLQTLAELWGTPL